MPDDYPDIEENEAMEADHSLDEIGKHIKQLKYGDLSAQVDALVILNELITSNLEQKKDSLANNASYMIDTISKVLYDVFNKPVESIPLKFGRYFISIVNKVCSIDFIVRPVPEKKIMTLVQQLLLKLLTPGLESLGERNEG